MHCLLGYQLFISNDGAHALLITTSHKFCLWQESSEKEETDSQWWQLNPPSDYHLFYLSQREAVAVDTPHPVLGVCCSCVTARSEQGTSTTLTHLLIRWPSAGDLLNPSRAHIEYW